MMSKGAKDKSMELSFGLTVFCTSLVLFISKLHGQPPNFYKLTIISELYPDP